MTRSFLQFAGSASTVVWATLLVGTLFTAPARAQYGADPSTCQDCYSCNENNSGCDYTGSGRACTNTLTCNCNRNNNNPICASGT